jgi:hypothetical protein
MCLSSSLAASLAIVACGTAGAQQRSVTLSPFVAFLPTGAPQPMAGLALAFMEGPVAFRGGAQLSIHEHTPLDASGSGAATHPWGVDLDAVAYLNGISYGSLLTFKPYVFTGIGTEEIDSAAVRIRRNGWSYGGGLALPFGGAVHAFGEFRWRMPRFVSPNAEDAPRPKGEARFGLSFRVGSGIPYSTDGQGGLVIPAGDVDGMDGVMAVLSTASRVLATADQYVGTRYRRGGSVPSTGFDAAGFVRFVFARFGVLLPPSSREQANVGEGVRADWHVIAPGDLLLFEDENEITHVAIYAGKNRIIHASETGGGVCYDDLSSDRGRWFLDRLVAVRRVTPATRRANIDAEAESASGRSASADRPDRAPRPTRRRP